MKSNRKEIKREKKRLRFAREAREQRNRKKYNLNPIFPKKRDIQFSDPKEKK